MTTTELRALLAEALQYIDPASGLAAHKLRARITAALSEKDEGGYSAGSECFLHNNKNPCPVCQTLPKISLPPLPERKV